ncbi:MULTISPECIES: adenosylcobinamide-GDP ribazoletransferase [unclassified Acinetobacter]|uniref:adenosylcobinamide-GDP ribazoletransferase n=1 Tax=unclassified Acinetobacter TaxID=196816 RepID=UPI0035BAA051
MMPFLIALQFLTTIPVRLPYMPSREQNALSLLFYPLIGLMIGGILWLMASFLTLPIMLLSILIVVAWIWLTGGLHLDGLADTADAWVGGYGDVERTLKIMKDPTCGAMGVIAIVLNIALKWACVYSLLELSHLNKSFLWILMFIPMLGRLSPLVLFLTTSYVRKNGLGSALQDVSKIAVISVILLTTFSLLFLGWQTALLLYLGFFASVFYLRWRFMQRIGGITGDTVGASIEIVEVLLLSLFIFKIY